MDKKSVTVEELRAIQDDLSERSKTDWVPGVQSAYQYAANLIGSILPPKRRPTLAEMTPEERAECQWMQAEYYSSSCVIIEPNTYTLNSERGYYSARVLFPDGKIGTVPHDELIPRPDLPKLEWPGDGVVDANIVEDDDDDSAENQQIEAWLNIADHKIFNECFSGESGSLLDAMIRKLDRMAEIEELATRK